MRSVFIFNMQNVSLKCGILFEDKLIIFTRIFNYANRDFFHFQIDEKIVTVKYSHIKSKIKQASKFFFFLFTDIPKMLDSLLFSFFSIND